ncbi:MAG: 50S ribosomal protein L4 [Flavobacteriales bacterium]|nr:50S ribosomal protein L4 [Flavobacteriales bacterium]MCX7768044.1 50S ribosomal protein L4 [Flavobacteriales bacterium]MDW8409249.1 50S ribosomal protein L4 [Flavobacteriales bacterium]
MELKVLTFEGEDTGRTVQLPDEIFCIEPNAHAVYLDIKHYLASQRQGTHKTKERGEVARTTRKAYRQKGTGGARRGSYKSPLIRGGGTVFGPKPRDYSFKLNKKVKALARASALSIKISSGALVVLDKVEIPEPKTRIFAQSLRKLQAADKKSLFVIKEPEKNVILSARNLKSAKVINASQLNTYEIMNCDKLFVTEAALPVVQSLITR